MAKPAQDVIFEKLVAQGILKQNMDQIVSRFVYKLDGVPFIAPPPLLAIHGIELNEAFLNRLIGHNIQLMTEGFINVSSPSSEQEPK